MDREEQDKIWNELSEQTRLEIRGKYKRKLIDAFDAKTKAASKILFGEHNLNPKQIKTWEDVEKDGHYVGINVNTELKRIDLFANDVSLKIQNKIQATLKIAKLIDLGYGGAVTEEEWVEQDIPKYIIVPSFSSEHRLNTEDVLLYSRKTFIAFHTPEQRNEFMSYESNRKLVEQYYMI